MESNDQQLILGLAERLRQAQPVHKDPQPAELIARHIASQPDVVYLLTQAVLVQEDALRAAQAQIADLNARLSAPPNQAGGGFLSGMFGRNQAPAAPAPAPAPHAAPAEAPPARSGGSFLKTAAAAAAGVAGGGLLLQGLNSAFGGGHESAPHETHLADTRRDEWEDESEPW